MLRSFIEFLLAGTIGLLVAFPVHAEVEERLEFNYYDVSVRHGERLLQAINRSSNIREDGKIFHGYTRWYVSWNYRWLRKPGSCRINTTKLDVTGTITLPQLHEAQPAQRKVFNAYVARLREHEIGHFDIALDAARAIESYLGSLPAFSDCSSLEQQANQGAHQILDDFRQRERQYDSRTGHGRTQGAYLDRDSP